MKQKVFWQGNRIEELEKHMSPDAAVVLWFVVQTFGGEVVWDRHKQRIDIIIQQPDEEKGLFAELGELLGFSADTEVQGLFDTSEDIDSPPAELLSLLHRTYLQSGGGENLRSSQLNVQSVLQDQLGTAGVQMPDRSGKPSNPVSELHKDEEWEKAKSEAQQQIEIKDEKDTEMPSEQASDDTDEDECEDSERRGPEQPEHKDSSVQLSVSYKPFYGSSSRSSGRKEWEARIGSQPGHLSPEEIFSEEIEMLQKYRPESKRSSKRGGNE